jgi:RNA polymerase sigma-70 factor, ECF subfamily
MPPLLSSPSASPHADLAEIPDELLMARIGRGEEAALVELIRRWQTPLLNFLHHSLNDFGRAEDLAQVAFVRIYRAAGRYQPTAKFSTYLFHIARRLLINEFHKARRRPLEATDPHHLHAIDPGESERRVEELEEVFRHTLERLPENQRSAILLLKQQQLSYAEIAAIMGSSESAVKTWIFRARQTLKQALESRV